MIVVKNILIILFILIGISISLWIIKILSAVFNYITHKDKMLYVKVHNKRVAIIDDKMSSLIKLYVIEYMRNKKDRVVLSPLQLHNLILDKCMGSLSEADKEFMINNNPKYEDYISYLIMDKMAKEYAKRRMVAESKSMFEHTMNAFFADMAEDDEEE